METQNKGITTKSWSVLSSKKESGGTKMTIGVAQDSFDFLRTHSNTLYCVMGRATFTVVKGCKENQATPEHSTINADDQARTERTQNGDGGDTFPDADATGDA